MREGHSSVFVEDYGRNDASTAAVLVISQNAVVNFRTAAAALAAIVHGAPIAHR